MSTSCNKMLRMTLFAIVAIALCMAGVTVGSDDFTLTFTPTPTPTPVITNAPASASPSPFPRAGAYPLLILTFTGVTVEQINGLVNTLADIIEFDEDLIHIYVSSASVSTTVASAVFLHTTSSDRKSMKHFASDQTEQNDLTDALALPRGCLKVRYVWADTSVSPDNFDDSSATVEGSFAVAAFRSLTTTVASW
eukprot:TRINITY_DN723_c0_g1_i1.p2 TRINITY_DN723_c0_g1~~TRINITY_DN723_c0_g1_i1.p2  ORF type:complete len:194 (+),score=27.74 TRINITY_DN723_c0_g1_i1:84-665(+)